MIGAEAKEAATTNSRRLSFSLSFTEDQKTQLHTALESALENFDEIRKSNSDLTKVKVVDRLRSVRTTARERAVKFLTPDQLTKWDAEVSKARTSLGNAA